MSKHIVGSSRRKSTVVETLRPGIHRVAVPFPVPLMTVNCYLLAEGREAVLVDTASAPGRVRRHIELLLAHAGVRPQEVTAILATHCHHDHIGGIADLQQLTGAPVLMHADERFTLAEATERSGARHKLTSWMMGHGVPSAMARNMVESLRWNAPEPIHSSRLLQDGVEIVVGSARWLVVHTPGHSPGHVCLYEPQQAVLITGDHVLPNESSNVSVRPGQPPNPLGAYLDALERVQVLNPRLCLPGHGEPFDDLSALVASQIRHHAARLEDVREALAGGGCTGFEVAATIPWVRRSKRLVALDALHRFLAFGETLAHLECLEARGAVRRWGTSPVMWELRA
jgi:glyoxylase-like metal-dependent hydrolase (beta-lactamase superfamily II)